MNVNVNRRPWPRAARAGARTLARGHTPGSPEHYAEVLAMTDNDVGGFHSMTKLLRQIQKKDHAWIPGTPGTAVVIVKLRVMLSVEVSS